jgi:type I restriction enzyme S subunit
MRLPTNWNCPNVEEICERVSVGIVIEPSKHYTSDPSGVRAFRSANVRAGRVNDSNWVRLSPEGHASNGKSHLRSGDVVIVRTGAPGTACVVTDEFAGSNCIDLIFARPKPDLVNSHYFCVFINSEHGKRQALNMQGGLAQQHLNVGAFQKIKVPLPPLPEQRKIADILNTWDEALEKLDAIIEAQERRKKALMQQLLTGRRRLKPHGVSIKHLKASEIFTNRSERNTGSLPVLSVTQDQGIVLRSSLERRIAHDEDNINTYKVVRSGDYVISLRSFQGGLEFSEVTGAVSPAYHVIRPITEIDQSFYRHYFKSTDFISRLAIATIGIRDGKQISFTDFGFIKLPYPAIEDQKRIGAILDTADQQLTLLRAQRAVLDQQKRGLMQRLLTGKLRVNPQT